MACCGGLKSFDENRRVVMGMACLFTVASLTLTIVALSAASDNTDVIKSTAWTYTDYGGGKEAYFGIFKSVIEFPGFTATETWEDCADTSSDCDDCQEAGETAVATSIVIVISCLISLWMNLMRFGDDDANWKKNVGVFAAVLGKLCSMTAVIVYGTTCYSDIYNDISKSGTSVSYGFGAMMAVVGCKLIEVFLHLLLPVRSTSLSGAVVNNV
jgi:hypothetical protein